MSEQKTIEQLKDHYQRLNEKRIQVEANLDNYNDQLKKLQEKLEKEYGTSDLAALREKLKKIKEENEQRRKEYQQHLAQIEENLAQIEDEYGKVDSGESA